MRFNSIEYEFIYLAIHHNFVMLTGFPSARNNLLIVVNHKTSPCCDMGDEENDESIARLIWNIAYSSG